MDPLVLAAHLANAATRIRFVYGVLVLPQHGPFDLRRRSRPSTASLQVGSHLGSGWLVARGTRAPGRCLRDSRRASSRSDRRLARALDDGACNARGGSFRLLPSARNPKLLQRPHPPIYVACGRDLLSRRTDSWVSWRSLILAEELAVEAAGVSIRLQAKLLIEKGDEAFISRDDRAPQAKCRFGSHGEAGELLVVRLGRKTAICVCKSPGCVARQ